MIKLELDVSPHVNNDSHDQSQPNMRAMAVKASISLREVAGFIGLAYATLRADWKVRAKDGRLQPPINAIKLRPLIVKGDPR